MEIFHKYHICWKNDHNSILLGESEARSHTNLSCINNIMQYYVDDNLMSDYHAKVIKEFAENKASEIDYDISKMGHHSCQLK